MGVLIAFLSRLSVSFSSFNVFRTLPLQGWTLWQAMAATIRSSTGERHGVLPPYLFNSETPRTQRAADLFFNHGWTRIRADANWGCFDLRTQVKRDNRKGASQFSMTAEVLRFTLRCG